MTETANGKSAMHLGRTDIIRLQKEHQSLKDAAAAEDVCYNSLRRRSLRLGLPWSNANRSVDIDELKELLDKNVELSEIAERFGVNRTSIWRNIRKLKGNK